MLTLFKPYIILFLCIELLLFEIIRVSTTKTKTIIIWLAMGTHQYDPSEDHYYYHCSFGAIQIIILHCVLCVFPFIVDDNHMGS